jgi:hypothetical protein
MYNVIRYTMANQEEHLMLRNRRGFVVLAIILSMLMIIGAIAVFGFVSGRLGTTYRLHRRPQAILDAESASYVAYMMMREGDWARDDTDADSKTVRFNHKPVTINLQDSSLADPEDTNRVQVTSPYR